MFKPKSSISLISNINVSVRILYYNMWKSYGKINILVEWYKRLKCKIVYLEFDLVFSFTKNKSVDRLQVDFAYFQNVTIAESICSRSLV